MATQDSTASLALKLKWMRQQFVRDLPTMDAAEKRQRQQELTDTEEALRKAEADDAD